MGWKDVPMPPQIAALPTDKRGFPVPWISDWDSDAVDNQGRAWSITEDHPVYGAYASACVHVDGEGEPNLGALCAPRQIQGMLARLCDVCGTKVGHTAYFMGGADLNDRGYYELPLHLDCALYAGQVCPGLVTKAKGQIWVSETTTYRCNMKRKFYPDRDQEFDGMKDPMWRLVEAVSGHNSIMIGIVAHPDDPQRRYLPLEDFLGEHGLKHPYRQESNA